MEYRRQVKEYKRKLWAWFTKVLRVKKRANLIAPANNEQTDLLRVCTEDRVFQMSKTAHTVDSAPLP